MAGMAWVAGAIMLTSGNVENWVWPCRCGGQNPGVPGVTEELGGWYYKGQMADDHVVTTAMAEVERMIGSDRHNPGMTRACATAASVALARMASLWSTTALSRAARCKATVSGADFFYAPLSVGPPLYRFLVKPRELH